MLPVVLPWWFPLVVPLGKSLWASRNCIGPDQWPLNRLTGTPSRNFSMENLPLFHPRILRKRSGRVRSFGCSTQGLAGLLNLATGSNEADHEQARSSSNESSGRVDATTTATRGTRRLIKARSISLKRLTTEKVAVPLEVSLSFATSIVFRSV